MHEKLSSSGIDPAFEKVTFENDASILFKHVTARRFRFVYHYHPEIELIYFAEGDGLEFIGDSSQAFKAGHLVLLGSNHPPFAGSEVEGADESFIWWHLCICTHDVHEFSKLGPLLVSGTVYTFGIGVSNDL